MSLSADRKTKRRDKFEGAAPWCALCGVEMVFPTEHVRERPDNQAVFLRLYRKAPREHLPEIFKRGLNRPICICHQCSMIINREQQRRSGPSSAKADSTLKFLKAWYGGNWKEQP